MRFGLFFLPVAATRAEARAEYDQILEECVEADEQGWDSVWFTEHHFDVYGGIMPSPFVMMAAAARITQTIRLGSAVSVLPLNDPVRIAEQAAMVDVLSNGRVDIGIGRGFMPHEFAAVSLDPEQRRTKARDGWRAIHAIWNEEPVSFSGESIRLETLRLMPRPLQSPHPPLWMAASTDRESFEAAGMHGFHLMLNPYNRIMEELDRGLAWYREAAEKAGFAWQTRRVLVNFPLFLAESASEARQGAQFAFERYVAAMESAFQRTNPGARVTRGDYDILAQKVLFGTPENISQRLTAWKAWGATDVSLMTRFADLPEDLARRSRALFINSVASHLR